MHPPTLFLSSFSRVNIYTFRNRYIYIYILIFKPNHISRPGRTPSIGYHRKPIRYRRLAQGTRSRVSRLQFPLTEFSLIHSLPLSSLVSVLFSSLPVCSSRWNLANACHRSTCRWSITLVLLEQLQSPTQSFTSNPQSFMFNHDHEHKPYCTVYWPSTIQQTHRHLR